MPRLFEVLRKFLGKAEQPGPVTDHLLHGGLSPSASNELFYAQLIEDKWDEKYRDYPWPPGWHN